MKRVKARIMSKPSSGDIDGSGSLSGFHFCIVFTPTYLPDAPGTTTVLVHLVGGFSEI